MSRNLTIAAAAFAVVVPVATIGALALKSPHLTGDPPAYAPPPDLAAPTPVTVTTSADASRLAEQATFGPTPALMAMISSQGAGPWLQAQFALRQSSYTDLASRTVPVGYCVTKTGVDFSNCIRDYFSALPVQMRFYADAVRNDDQLRQRVAFALSQILVASDLEVHNTAGLATFNQIFLDNAFGNYRDIIKAVTLNPYMGSYLNLANSNKSAPSENYARELMQLFSVGVAQLNADGSPRLDANGAPIPNYTGLEVHDVARALTGWTYARLPGAAANDGAKLDYSRPMVVVPANYDTAAKSFLGRTVPAGAGQAQSLDAVVDAVFQNAGTAPFISKQLIQQLVKSNPSSGYVARVSAVFADDGAGVRGDMKAVLTAILTDAEARGSVKADAADGKVKEPVLLLTNLVRAISGASDGYAFTTRDAGMAEQPFRAPSVFNFYPPDYPLPQGGGLVSPVSKLITTSTVLNRHNLAYDWTVGWSDKRGEFLKQAAIPGATGTQFNWSAWEAFGPDVDGMLQRVDLLFFNGAMTTAQRSALRTAVMAVTDPNATTQARRRAQTALYIAASAPQYQVAR